MAKKSCKKGYYYCFTDKKCKRIPKGWHVMSSTGRLMRDSEHQDENENEGKKKNGNGNGSNGNGNGNGGSDGGSNGGGDNPKGFSRENRKTMKLQWHKVNSKSQQETSQS